MAADRVLVTGGAGFIGSALVDRLIAEGHRVDVVDDLSSGTLANLAQARRKQRSFSFTQMDLRDPALTDLLLVRKPRVVFHLGAQSNLAYSVEQPVFDAEVNVLGGLRVLDAARAAGVRKVVFAASGGSLYDTTDEVNLPATEHAPRRPRSPYGVAKSAMLDYLTCYRELYGLEFTALALGNVYGPRQESGAEGGVVAIFAHQLLAGERCSISGDGAQTRDFVYVDDVVDAFSRAAERGSGLVLNVGTGVETSIRELYDQLCQTIGITRAPKRVAMRPGEVRRSVLDVSRAELHLKWKPWTTLSVGLEAVVEGLRGDREAAP